MSVGYWSISDYTLRIGIALGAALIWWWADTRSLLSRPQAVFLLLFTGIGAFLAGRAGFVLENRLYFEQNPAHITALHKVGGIHGSAALGSATLTLLLGCKILSVPARKVMRSAVPAIFLIALGAWRGCILAGCAYGHTATAPARFVRFFVADGRDLYGTVTPRLAVQQIAAAGALFGVIGSIGLRKHALLWIALYAFGCAALTLLRGDTVPVLGSLRSDSLGWCAVGALYTLLAVTLCQSKERNARLLASA